MDWWVAQWYQISPILLYSWVLWVILSICLHELGHGWMAIRCGDNTPRALGHMTMNPMVHIPWPWAWVMFALFGFTWGLMPVSPDRFRGRYDDAKVAAAGPAVNLILAVLCIAGSVGWLFIGPKTPDNVQQNVAVFLWTGVMINFMGVVFNLIPVPPLDGSRILADFSGSYRRLIYSEQGAVISLLCAMLLFSAASGPIWGVTFRAADWSLRIAASLAGQNWPGRPF
ncbi:MAG: site-2 protease family protein [Phycisphaerales bacterium]